MSIHFGGQLDSSLKFFVFLILLRVGRSQKRAFSAERGALHQVDGANPKGYYRRQYETALRW